MINRGVDEKAVVNLALNNSKIMDIIKEQPIKKTIYIKDKILNFIV
jgi:leucyl-tRNA synthetase